MTDDDDHLSSFFPNCYVKYTAATLCVSRLFSLDYFSGNLLVDFVMALLWPALFQPQISGDCCYSTVDVDGKNLSPVRPLLLLFSFSVPFSVLIWLIWYPSSWCSIFMNCLIFNSKWMLGFANMAIWWLFHNQAFFSTYLIDVYLCSKQGWQHWWSLLTIPTQWKPLIKKAIMQLLNLVPRGGHILTTKKCKSQWFATDGEYFPWLVWFSQNYIT